MSSYLVKINGSSGENAQGKLGDKCQASSDCAQQNICKRNFCHCPDGTIDIEENDNRRSCISSKNSGNFMESWTFHNQ